MLRLRSLLAVVLGLAALVPIAAVLPVAVLVPVPAQAQDRMVNLHYHPTRRAQIAIWVQSEDGSRFLTSFLTERTALYGIGNRPGALQMNSAFRWPYGRREGVLPVWAHRRYDATGVLFPRVIFAGRESEGNASSAGSIGEITNTRDDSYCLSFTPGDESLDAMTCATPFMSNKGRYLTADDVEGGYAEPWEEPGGSPMMRPLQLGSLYPPRHDDAVQCIAGCPDHPDVRSYGMDAREVMPEIDAVTRPTPGDAPTVWQIGIPEDWPDGEYLVFVEINTEGDYATGWDATAYPTPRLPSGQWDTWAINYGYPYRGQPSVVYSVRFQLDSRGGEWSATEPLGYGDLHGRTGEIHAMDSTIRDDHEAAPGSGADRLQPDPDHDGARLRVVVPPTDVCSLPDPPEECGRECDETHPCPGTETFCSPTEFQCVDRCTLTRPPTAIAPTLERYPEQRHTHEYARLRFEVPESANAIRQYSVRVSTSAIDPTDFDAFQELRGAKEASQDDIALEIDLLVMPDGSDCPDGAGADRSACVPRAPGSTIEVDIGHLSPETHYWVGVAAQDDCNDWAQTIGVAEIETTQINFTTVSPCFVATAAYGTPLDARIGVLRRFRDRHLRTNAVGRALVSAYETLGPIAAGWIAEDEDRRALARAVLEPIVRLLEAL